MEEPCCERCVRCDGSFRNSDYCHQHSNHDLCICKDICRDCGVELVHGHCHNCRTQREENDEDEESRDALRLVEEITRKIKEDQIKEALLMLMEHARVLLLRRIECPVCSKLH